MKIEFIPVSKKINLKSFNCGIEELNIYLHRFALPNEKRQISRTFIAVNEDNPITPLGYYSVSMSQIQFNKLPEKLKKGIPRYPLPAMRIGRLARDISVNKKGLGALLLQDAFNRALMISEEIGVHSILVDALNEGAKSFYLKYGFIPFNDKPLTLILPLKTLKAI